MILITGAAGFIGYHTSKKFLENKMKVVGVDNINNYYSKKLKLDRIKNLKKSKFKNYFKFYKVDITDEKRMEKIFKKEKIKFVIHLAAQAGVRYSLVNPNSYTKNNLLGTSTILELSRKYKIKDLYLASTSSVYGLNKKYPFSENLNTDRPGQYYAATKKSNEVMAFSYSHLFKLRSTVFRFFTVYGPWGRPDMALFKFTNNMIKRKPIPVFNYGNHVRDFTYVEDVANILFKVFKKKKNYNFNIFNIGNNKPVNLKVYIKEIEKNLNIKSKKKLLPLQTGDVYKTFSDSNKLYKFIKYKPKTDVKYGIKEFVKWYINYFNIKKNAS
tara:strand:- start:3415 stop:4395 length:981 start_codon:yes stop_codon:yes gene_type:complete